MRMNIKIEDQARIYLLGRNSKRLREKRRRRRRSKFHTTGTTGTQTRFHRNANLAPLLLHNHWITLGQGLSLTGRDKHCLDLDIMATRTTGHSELLAAHYKQQISHLSLNGKSQKGCGDKCRSENRPANFWLNPMGTLIRQESVASPT